MEPRFSLPDSTPRSSKKEIVIGGLRAYVYGLEELKHKSDVDIAVLYLAHNRTRTYLVTECIAQEVLNRYRTDGRVKKLELIAVTFNMRNHGDREISPAANRTWKDGNEAHGVDLLSLIDGSAQDFQLLLNYMPAYLRGFRRFYNVVGGVSLGAHMAWRMAALSGDQIHAMWMVVGCPNLTSLLLSRLDVNPADLNTTAEQLYKVPYDDLYTVMTEEQRRKWPRRLSEILRDSDRAIDEEFPAHIPLLLQNGLLDQLVPYKYTMPWVDKYKNSRAVEFFVQDNTGHSCTKEMVANIAVWLAKLFQEV
ncbi:Alpha/Beta hydrolase protein [Lipomyces starkeyi]|uniref:AB hydrolase-1 domain-containing protein n=1 Tax=Lipomyces starkeyi NRRL Y-11557 TaxID=675824 RepID=A0A1E3QEA4_LIPST|nr:hypothetical protein LIPSTDRAFT_91482 [Lipomyces starkeyi NRRL Y-11557]